MMNESKPEEIRFGACYRVSKFEFAKHPEEVMLEAEKHLRLCLADYIQREKSIKVDNKNEEFFELRLELYVATPEEFWKIVNRDAQRIATRFSPA